MPKKTKKEKLLARYHRKLRLLENKQEISPPVQIKTPATMSISPVENETKPNVNVPTTYREKELNQYFFSDLKKSLLLTIFILGLEVSLYFAKLIKQ